MINNHKTEQAIDLIIDGSPVQIKINNAIKLENVSYFLLKEETFGSTDNLDNKQGEWVKGHSLSAVTKTKNKLHADTKQEITTFSQGETLSYIHKITLELFLIFKIETKIEIDTELRPFTLD